jgi:hypothetical protein
MGKKAKKYYEERFAKQALNLQELESEGETWKKTKIDALCQLQSNICVLSILFTSLGS